MRAVAPKEKKRKEKKRKEKKKKLTRSMDIFLPVIFVSVVLHGQRH
jgi:hypothetical protein